MVVKQGDVVWVSLPTSFGSAPFEYLDRARAAGAVAEQDIDKTVRRHYCRRDVRNGNWSGPKARIRAVLHDVKRHFMAGRRAVLPYKLGKFARRLGVG